MVYTLLKVCAVQAACESVRSGPRQVPAGKPLGLIQKDPTSCSRVQRAQSMQ